MKLSGAIQLLYPVPLIYVLSSKNTRTMPSGISIIQVNPEMWQNYYEIGNRVEYSLAHNLTMNVLNILTLEYK